jgi:IS5 family transposase
MRPKERRDSGQNDLFRSRLDQIVDLGHPLAKLAQTIDWRFLEERFGAVYTDRPGQPPLPTRLMAGLSILKHTHDLSDEELCARWVENPYYQLFCGEEFFLHKLPFDRSSLTRWRQRMGEEKLVALIQESLNVATRTRAAKPSDFARVIVDTTVQPKAVAFPTDAKLMHRARERLVRLAKRHGVRLRQSYARVGKRALMAYQRYAHAKQFKRANKALRSVRTYPAGFSATSFARPEATRPCAGSSPSRCLSPSGCATSARPSAGERSIRCTRPRSNASARVRRTALTSSASRSRSPLRLPPRRAGSSSPPEIETQVGASLARIVADRGYRGHNAPPDHKMKVYISGQKRGVTEAIKRDLRRRSAVEPVIGHAKAEHRMGRNFLKGMHGDAANAVLAAAGYNFRRLLAWLALLWRVFIMAALATASDAQIGALGDA